RSAVRARGRAVSSLGGLCDDELQEARLAPISRQHWIIRSALAIRARRRRLLGLVSSQGLVGAPPRGACRRHPAPGDRDTRHRSTAHAQAPRAVAAIRAVGAASVSVVTLSLPNVSAARPGGTERCYRTSCTEQRTG